MFFDLFPQTIYTFKDPAERDFKTIVNIFVRTAMLQSVFNNITLFYPYYIKDSDTPEIIAAKYYNDPTAYWIILYTNQILDPYYQWPLNYTEFQAQLVSNYGSVANSQSTLDHIEKHTNVIVTENYQVTTNTYVTMLANNVYSLDGSTTFPTLDNPIIQVGANNVVDIDGAQIDTSVQLYAISGYQQLFNLNEANRNIQIIDSAYAAQITAQLQNLLENNG